MTCPRCHSNNIIIQTVDDTVVKHRGCIRWFFWILLAVLTWGLIIIIPIMTNTKIKHKSHTEAICQNCGKRWRI